MTSSSYDTFGTPVQNSFPRRNKESEDDALLENMESGRRANSSRHSTHSLQASVSFDDSETLKRTEDDVPEKSFATSFANFGRRASTINEEHEKYKWSCFHQAEERVLVPWGRAYQIWWALTVFGAAFTIFFETYQVSFASAAVTFPFADSNSSCETILTIIFALDVVFSFHLAYYNERDELVTDKLLISKKYLKSKFVVDMLALLPFQFLSLLATGNLGQENTTTQYLALLRLFRLLRLYRVRDCFEMLSVDTRISLITLTLFRNLATALVWTHMSACTIYFIAKQYDMDHEETFLGSQVAGMDTFGAYVSSLYWSMVTFATVGYGDFVAHNNAEKIWAITYMVLNLVIQAWIIGSITLLMIKKDETTGHYRDTLETLDQYSAMHSFDPDFHQRLKSQLQLDFSTREIADEQVLRNFPASIRRKVLRRLYMPYLTETKLMTGVRPQFVDAFLTTSRVEIFSPGEEIVRRHAISSDLYLLVGGKVEKVDNDVGSSSAVSGLPRRVCKAGDFLNEIGFFTETPEIETLRTVTVCKAVTISKASYKLLVQDHPGSAGRILQNLLEKVEESRVLLPQPMENLRAGSVFFEKTGSTIEEDGTVSAVQELVQMHIEKQKDDHTTRFLFSASRGDTNTIAVMCDQGFDANSCDYDSRTALMVAAMKGNFETVKKLLECGADPNLVDMHGSTALYEAARMGHLDTMRILLAQGASLNMAESKAASTLDQAVFDGDIVLLRRLLEAKIQVNASDYDKRAAVHIAAAEGNVAALRTMIEYGADLTLKDRWGNTVKDEAKRAGAAQLLQFLLENGL